MTIRNAHDAFWFLHEHPKLKYREAVLLTPAQAKTVKLNKGERIRIVKDEMQWNKKRYPVREFALRGESFPLNLDIFYTKVDKTRKVNDDKSQNKFIECWLEFGPVEYVVEDGTLHRRHFHDINLDCGGPTFEIALMKLTKLVKKHYGDYAAPKWVTE
jgi:hypothetical protein